MTKVSFRADEDHIDRFDRTVSGLHAEGDIDHSNRSETLRCLMIYAADHPEIIRQAEDATDQA
jgi:hypothetical protein